MEHRRSRPCRRRPAAHRVSINRRGAEKRIAWGVVLLVCGIVTYVAALQRYATPFSTVGALVVANAEEVERAQVYRGLLLWGGAMVLTTPIATWLIFTLTAV